MLAKELVLASSSEIRRKILNDNGISYIAKNHNFDEKILKIDKTLTPSILSLQLAREKALSLKDEFMHHIILGCDQVCLFKDKIYSKPLTADKAVENLLKFSGQTHQLIGSYVFIRNGFSQQNKKHVKILEIGMGTGLNILLTFLNSDKNSKIYYHALEPYPLDESLQKKLNYCQLLDVDEEILKKILQI